MPTSMKYWNIRVRYKFYLKLPRRKRMRLEADLPHMRWHDLRHSAATILLSMNIYPKIVQELLGHSTINMTLDVYSHAIPSMQKDITDGWNKDFES